MRKNTLLPLTLASLLGLAGCLGKPVPVTNFYVLNATAAVPERAPTANAVSVYLAEIVLPDYLERGQVVARETRNRLRLSDFEMWGGSLRKDVGRVIAANLGRLLNTPDVLMSPLSVQDRPDYRVQVNVLGFEAGPSGQVHLRARWNVRRDDDGRKVAGGLERLSSPSAGGMDATVAAMSELLGELSSRIAAGIPAGGSR